MWLAPDAIAAWEAVGVGTRGGQRPYSDLAIEPALTLRLIFPLPLRQTEGCLTSIVGRLGLALSAPDHTTRSRRGQQLDLPLRRAPTCRSPTQSARATTDPVKDGPVMFIPNSGIEYRPDMRVNNTLRLNTVMMTSDGRPKARVRPIWTRPRCRVFSVIVWVSSVPRSRHLHGLGAVEKLRTASTTSACSESVRPVKNGRRTSRPLTSSVTGQSPGRPPNRCPISDRWSGK